MTRHNAQSVYLLCIKNEGYPASLDVRKVYTALNDLVAAERGLVRVIDESGDDYLYPHEFFVPIEIPKDARICFATVESVGTKGESRQDT